MGEMIGKVMDFIGKVMIRAQGRTAVFNCKNVSLEDIDHVLFQQHYI